MYISPFPGLCWFPYCSMITLNFWVASFRWKQQALSSLQANHIHSLLVQLLLYVASFQIAIFKNKVERF